MVFRHPKDHPQAILNVTARSDAEKAAREFRGNQLPIAHQTAIRVPLTVDFYTARPVSDIDGFNFTSNLATKGLFKIFALDLATDIITDTGVEEEVHNYGRPVFADEKGITIGRMGDGTLAVMSVHGIITGTLAAAMIEADGSGSVDVLFPFVATINAINRHSFAGDINSPVDIAYDGLDLFIFQLDCPA